MATTAGKVSAIDRMGLTLFLAVSLHATLILGLAFQFDKPARPPAPERTLEIMVVQNPKPEKKPEKADFLAQASQQGGGEQEKALRPTVAPTPPPAPAPQPVVAPPQPTPKPVKPPETKPEKRVITQKKPTQKKVVKPQKPVEKPPEKPKVSAAQLLASTSAEINRLTAELDRKTRAYAKRPRRKQINAATQEYKYANYLDAWRRKVERVGNLNYPDEAKRRKLYGNLVLNVSVRADGTVASIRVMKSSGHKLLDDAAKRIVRLASPFAPFPAEIRNETDILDITRTWQFLNSNQLFSR